MLTFRDLWLPVARRMGDMSPGAIAVAKEYINRVAREIAQRATWPQLCDEKHIITVDEYTTGNCDVTQNSYTLDGGTTAPTWTMAMVGRTFALENSEARYRIKTYSSATVLGLDIPYKGTTATDQDYRIFKDEYELERDTIGVIKMQLPDDNTFLSPGDMRRYFDVRDHIEESSTPSAYFAVGATESAYYSTGTVTVTPDSTTVTGAGTAWDASMVGRQIRFKDDMPRRLYRILSVGGVTSITLESAYRGMGGDTIQYEIDPAGIPLVKLWPRPDDAYDLYYYRKRAPKELFDDDEVISDWADEFGDVLVVGATYLALKECGKTDLAQMEKMDFEKLLAGRIASSAVTDPDMVRQSRQWGQSPAVSVLPGKYPVTIR